MITGVIRLQVCGRRLRNWRLIARCASIYVQGQSPDRKIREYFYFIDHQGQLFLDDARIKNFTSCFKEKEFLKFFHSRIQPNTTGRYEDEFPYLSLCGRERNFIRCDDVPVVFTELIQAGSTNKHSANANKADHLTYAGGTLSVPFHPACLAMLPESGRVYHTGPDKTGGVGLIKSSLAIELSKQFIFENQSASPTHIQWRGHTYRLSNDVIAKLHKNYIA